MAERRRKGRRRDKRFDPDEKPTKQELAVAKHLRFKCPCKTSVIFGDQVSYFNGSKAVDVLLESRWAVDKKELLFTNRQNCVYYLQDLLDKGFFFRARKLIPKRRERNESKCESREKGKNTDYNDIDDKTTKKEINSVEKKPKKIKLDFHADQVYIDGNDVYVWKYNPTPPKTFLLGLLMVIGSALLCLFPLWPANVRVGVYYISLLAMAFIAVIMALVVVRTIIFWFIWTVTLGKHNFWILPNLTEDCGFFESFKPLYTYTVVNSAKKGKSKRRHETHDDTEDVNDRVSDSSERVVNAEVKTGAVATTSDSSNSGDEYKTTNAAGKIRQVSSVSEFELLEKPIE